MGAGDRDQVVVRDLRPEDLETVVRIEEESFDELNRYDRADFERALGEGAILKVADLSGSVVGYALGFAEGSECYVDSLAVSPGHRGMGVGRALLLSLLEECERRGASVAELEVSASNERAVSLYWELGFEVVGVVERSWGRGEVYVMRRDLRPAGAHGDPDSAPSQRRGSA